MVGLALAPSCGSGSSGGGPTGGAGGSGGTGGSVAMGGAGGNGGTTASQDGSTSHDGSAGACLGSSLLSALGKDHLLVGGSMEAATAAMAPFDLQYVYISSGLADGSGPCTSCASGCTSNGTTCAGGACDWWGCWVDTDPPGDYARSFVSTWTTAKPPQVPMFSYYQIFQSSGVTQGADEVTQAATNATFMARYFADWRFLLQQVGSAVAFLHVEPDFWGFAEQLASDPTTLPAAVASANTTDCGSLPNTIAGMGQCMIAMTRKYAPHAFVGLHASAWSTNTDISLNTETSLDVAGQAKETAAFLAACGETKADFVVVETSDVDAGYAQTVEMQDTWWDPTDATLPDFKQDLTWVSALTEALGTPALYWQTPLGNAKQDNTTNHYQDNRVDYFFGGSAATPESAPPVTVPSHWSQLAASHVIGVAFGTGGVQTSPETDGGNFVTKANAYFSSGGQALCP
jgi:hypothetical protein